MDDVATEEPGVQGIEDLINERFRAIEELIAGLGIRIYNFERSLETIVRKLERINRRGETRRGNDD